MKARTYAPPIMSADMIASATPVSLLYVGAVNAPTYIIKKGVVNAITRRSTVSADNKLKKNGGSPKDTMTIAQCIGNIASTAAARPAGKTAIQRMVFIVGSVSYLGKHVNID